MHITSIPSLLGVFALAFLLLLIAKVIKQPAEDKPAKALLLLMLTGLISMSFCLFYLYADMARYWPAIAYIEIGFVYWIGPSLYCYIKRLNGGPNPFRNPANLLHWVPAIAIELMLLPYFLTPVSERPEYLAGLSSFHRVMVWGVWRGFHVHVVIYILLSQPLLRQYRQRVLNNFAHVPIINLRWLQFLCYGLIGQILSERLLPVLNITSEELSDAAGMVVYAFMIALTYTALGQSRLHFAGDCQPPATNGKYHRSGLRDDSAQYYLDRLNMLMTTEKIFLENDLSLLSLADMLKISPHHLSQVLNEKLQRNFYDYINGLRVDYAKQRLVEDASTTITDLAFESGYNSKKSFYNAFKRHAGMSPSDYRNAQQSP